MNTCWRHAARFIAVCCTTQLLPALAAAQVDPRRAEAYLKEAAVLCERDGGTLTVAAPASVAGPELAGDGWTLKVAPGWVVRPGPRPNDYQLVRDQK